MKKDGFTLMEILIVVAIVMILAVVTLFILNPRKQIDKTSDTKRKAELSSLKKVLEDWYNDKNCYPIDTQICYDHFDSERTCHVCGTNSDSPSFNPYLSKLPCDPRSPTKDYLYQVDNVSCPTWFRVYTNLSYEEDPDINMAGCTSGCGSAPTYSYNYGVTSPNISLEKPPTCPGDLWCWQTGLLCKHCGALGECTSGGCGSPLHLFSDSACTVPCSP